MEISGNDREPFFLEITQDELMTQQKDYCELPFYSIDKGYWILGQKVIQNYYSAFNLTNSVLSIGLKDPNFDPFDDEPDHVNHDTKSNAGIIAACLAIALLGMLVTGMVCRRKKIRSVTFATGLLNHQSKVYAQEREKEIQQFVKMGMKDID